MNKNCTMCPRHCGADRTAPGVSTGFCRMPWTFKIARAALHFWEEPCISGSKGSGTVFFSGCNLRCVYCQNGEISLQDKGEAVSSDKLVKIFDSLIEQGAHNINLVNPTHYAYQLSEVLRTYKSPVPIVYNSGGYESLETLKLLDGLVDIYLPDLKYCDSEKSMRYSGAKDYFEVASKAILEMARQVGENVFAEDGTMKKGLIVRHLILPQNTNASVRILEWLKEYLPAGNQVSVMSQYLPCSNASEFPEINRRITAREYEKVLYRMNALGFEDGYVQERESADACFIPSFDLTGIL